MKYYFIVCTLMAFIFPALTQAALTPEKMKAYCMNGPSFLEIADVKKSVQALVGGKEYKNFDALTVNDIGNGCEMDVGVKGVSNQLFSGFGNGGSAFVLIAVDGRIWVALRDEAGVRTYTNAKVGEKLPTTLTKWGATAASLKKSELSTLVVLNENVFRVENFCRLPAGDEYKNFNTVKDSAPSKKLRFVQRFADCDEKKSKDCTVFKTSYLIPGDKVVVAREEGKWACVLYANRASGAVQGWVEKAHLEKSSVPIRSPLKDLVGTWESVLDPKVSFFSAEIKISGADGAQWEAEGSYKTITGEFTGTAKAEAGVFKLTEDECEITAKYSAPYLFVSDNRNCGGINFTFDSLYIRKK